MANRAAMVPDRRAWGMPPKKVVERKGKDQHREAEKKVFQGDGPQPDVEVPGIIVQYHRKGC